MAQFLTSKTLNYNLCELVKQEALRCIADHAISVCCFPFVDSIQKWPTNSSRMWWNNHMVVMKKTKSKDCIVPIATEISLQIN